MKNLKQQLSALLASLFYVLMAGTPALADDTEVLMGTSSTSPNVVFIIDTSGSMKDPPSASTATAKLDIVKSVYNTLVGTLPNINGTIMRFDGPVKNNEKDKNGKVKTSNEGGYFLMPMTHLEASTKQTFLDAIASLTADGRTPLAETLYEATQYYRGGAVRFGMNTTPYTNATNPTTVNFNAAATMNAAQNTYVQPTMNECTKNYIVYLTDGEPTDDGDADGNTSPVSDIQGLPNFSTRVGTGYQCDFTADPSDDCLDELAKYLNVTDFNTTVAGTQNVNLYTIGFASNQTLLGAAAANGGGKYFYNDSATQLATDLGAVLNEITASNTSNFTSPSMGVDAYSTGSSVHRNEMYYSLFKPAGTQLWDGNIKPYKIDKTTFEVVDNTGAVAVDSNDQFLATSRSLWSNVADGDPIVAGGANGRKPIPADRHLYTYTGTNTNLTNSTNALTTANLALTFADFGVADAAAKDATITKARDKAMRDPMHSQALVVNYGSGTASAPDGVVFVGTNAGFLYALDAATGDEKFAFIPKTLLPNLARLETNGVSHTYGLDGSPVAWVQDLNGNGRIMTGNAVETDEKVYVYTGMRMGGRNYYALDATSPASPVFKWAITGGAGDFAELGQTWSTPNLAKVRYGGADKQVLIFGGGYDPNQENYLAGADSMGRAIYIVDAETGARLWWAGPTGTSGANTLAITNLTYSVPGDVRVLDMDRDGYADRIYFGDMGGQVFRIDLAGQTSTSTGFTASAIRVANLGEGNTTTPKRRFYNTPDVVLAQKTPTATPYLAINIGSGYRGHPKDKGDATTTPARSATADRFYSLKDPNVYNVAAADYDITNSDVYDATGTATTNNKGWYLPLATGEKVLARSRTTKNVVSFTTYTPNDNTSSCSLVGSGAGKWYQVNLYDGAATRGTGRAITLPGSGIPPAPTLLFLANTTTQTVTGTGSGTITVTDQTPLLVECVGFHCAKLDPPQTTKTYWKQE